jgi:hypothetical protein
MTTNHVVRLYALALALAVFFLTWAVVAAHPWAATASEEDPRLAALERREERLRRKSERVQRVVERRFATYERRLARRRELIARASSAPVASTGVSAPVPAPSAAPSVSVVDLPPVTSSGSS